MTTISILIPCYNVGKYINDTFKSIESQNYDINLLKIICVDDGSTDNTLAILKKWQEKLGEKIVTVISQKNKGIYLTRRLLLKDLNTDYAIFLDADDWWDNNHLHSFSLKFKNSPDIIWQKKFKNWDENEHYKKIPLKFVFGKLGPIRFIKTTSPLLWDKMLNVNFLKKINIYEQLPEIDGCVRSEDGFINLWINSFVKTIAINRGITYNYRFNPNSIMRNKTSLLTIDDSIRSIRIFYKWKKLWRKNRQTKVAFNKFWRNIINDINGLFRRSGEI
ncbi:MAG: hypothetical protein Ta2E_02430 [Mycoplasmoidaceae bacterium]|nr:MAG: hypothetical protein Ta2E_02430 [Mycoplasmoidaceae bacterium]